MDWNDEQLDPLDDLLQKAAWPAPRTEQLDRLASKWRGTVRRRKLRNAAVVVVAIVPVAALAWSVTSWQRHQAAIPHGPADSPMIAADRPNPLTPALTPGERENEANQTVRQPTAYELAVATLYRHQAGLDQQLTAMPKPQPVAADPITVAIDRLVEDPQLDAPAMAKELSTKSPHCEAFLTAHCRSDSVNALNQRRSALRLLALVATRDSLPLLHSALSDDDCPVEVPQAIARLSNVEQLAWHARNEALPARQRLWIAAILQRGTFSAVSTFLELAADPSTSTAAFSAAQSVDDPPIDELFAALQSNRVPTRNTAARVLGALNNPAISQRLAQMALGSAGRREALVGLLSSSDPVAREFLAIAEHNLELAPSIRALAPRF